ncbi:gliding motility protein GldC [Tunicatimonas pelagia]|uniref:gliding motility protein GldC n=1 Tax=Tunicatimonas pelagia TaxID=931531 RepID=UPI0026664317|nr:gliding motility protein GldC [Tunicatimonas pelagia]WKN43617.1 gliding motility protein GldC [Tunicatimonas pelagia]
MKKSEINITVSLDEANIPENISWSATDGEGNPQVENGPSQSKSMSLSFWDDQQKNTLRIDLWTKEMPVDEMKRFCIDAIGGLAQTTLNATGDSYMAQEMNDLCDRLVQHVENEMKNG